MIWRARTAGERRGAALVQTGTGRAGRLPALGWLRRSAPAALGALALLVASEGCAAILRRTGAPRLGWGLDHRVDPGMYEPFVTALVGAFAVLLALFFTTLGVVAAEAYAEVSEQVRAVFLGERENNAYVKAMVRALVFGTVLLVAHAVGYDAYAATIVVFAALSLVCLLGSAALGMSLFSFFDVTRLAAPIPRRFLQAAAHADASGAHENARAALQLHRDVLQLVTKRSGTRMTASDALTSTLQMWAGYARLKGAIATDCAWFAPRTQQPNWLTQSPLKIHNPLVPGSVPATVSPDLVWVERELAEHCATALRRMVAEGDWPAVVAAEETTGELAGELMARLQMDEALLLCATVTAVVDHAGGGEASARPGDGAPDQARSARARTDAVKTGPTVRSRMWLGLATAAARATQEHVGASLQDAARAPNALTVADDLPVGRELREALDELSTGLSLETAAQGLPITPGWWLTHIAARVLTHSLHTAARRLLQDATAYLPARAEAVAALGDGQASATFALAALETVHGTQDALEHVRRAAEHLGRLRRQEASDEAWPTWEPDQSGLQDLRARLLRTLAGTAQHLPADAFTSDEPDLLGRTYLVLVETLFEAVMVGDETLALAVFSGTMTAALRAHRRTTIDVDGLPQIQHLIHATAPLIDMMQVSGYILFMDAAGATSIWPSVRAAWDQVTADGQDVPVYAQILAARHSRVPADMRRSGWETRFARWLDDRSIAHRRGGLYFGPEVISTHPEPLVAAVTQFSRLSTYLMADLFVIEYLTTRPGGQELASMRAFADLRDALARARERQEGQST